MTIYVMLPKELPFVVNVRWWESDLRGRALKFQQHQRTGTFQDVKVKQERLLPVAWRAVKREYQTCLGDKATTLCC